MANLQKDKNELEKAELSYLEALEIQIKLAKKNPQTFLPDLGLTQINLGIFHHGSKVNKDLSIQFVDEAITNLLPFQDIPYIQSYFNHAFYILDKWGVDIEAYWEEKLREYNNDKSIHFIKKRSKN